MLNPGVVEAKPESVDVKEYLAVLLKRKWLILVCFLLSTAGTTAFLFTRQPIYRANAKLLVTQLGIESLKSEVVREDMSSFYGTQIDILLSQTMLKRVQQRMKKTVDEFHENLTDVKVVPVRGSDIIMVSVDSPSIEFAKDFANTLCDEFLRFRAEERARTSESALLMLTREINRLSQELKAANQHAVDYAKEAGLPAMDLSDSWQGKMGYYITQRMVGDTFDLARAEARQRVFESKPNPETILALISAEKTASGQRMAEIPQTSTWNPASPVTSDPSQTLTNLATAEPLPSDITNVLSKTERDRVETDPRVAGHLQDDSFSQTFGALTDQQAERLFNAENKRKNLEVRLQNYRAIYKPKHPSIIQAERELQEAENDVAAQIEFLRSKADADVRVAKERLEATKGSVANYEKGLMSLNVKLFEMRALKSDVERIQLLYNTLVSQLMKIDVTHGFNTRTVSVLEPATLEPEPVYPKKVKGLLIAAFFGLGLGLALAFFIEYIDDSIKLAEEVERDLQLPFLGMIPAAQWSPDDLTAHRLDKLKQQGGVAEAYRVVRSAIIFSTPREKLRSILLTSAVPREGKTTTCVNLAIGFAQIEERVLLIDGDLRRGEVHKYFGLERDKGVSDVLLGEATCDQVIKHTSIPKLDVITSGTYPANPAELLLGWRLKELLEWAYKNYDRVIIDCTPVMGIADSAILGSAVDGCLFVIWAGRTSRRYVRVAKMTAVSRGAKIFGFVLNNLEPGRVGYYHYYPYYYSYYSRGYYYTRPEESDAGKGGDIKGIEVPAPEGGEEEIDDVY